MCGVADGARAEKQKKKKATHILELLGEQGLKIGSNKRRATTFWCCSVKMEPGQKNKKTQVTHILELLVEQGLKIVQKNEDQAQVGVARKKKANKNRPHTCWYC